MRSRPAAGTRRGLSAATSPPRAGTTAAAGTSADGRSRRTDLRRCGTPADGLLHGHERLHRLQGLRVACKEWNQIPPSPQGFTGESYDNTIDLGADTWRHVAFIEQRKPLDVG